MKSFCFFVLNLFVGSVIAQHGMPFSNMHHKAASDMLKRGHPSALSTLSVLHSKESEIAVSPPVFPPTTPQRVGESDKKKQCPAGFEFLGKQCAKTLDAEPTVVCPPGTLLVEDRCVKYLGKVSECPPGFMSSKGGCVKKSTASPESLCPEGFVLSGKDTCSRKVPLSDKKVCPAGSIAKGDSCVVTSVIPPEFVCPTGYTLIGQKCKYEETFDCTPQRPETHGKEHEQHSKSENVQMNSLLHNGQAGHGKSDVARYTLKEAAPIVEEYVVQKTCKRIVTEPARRICPDQSFLDGKVCRTEQYVEPLWKKAGFRDEFAPIIRRCPPGFTESEDKSICEAFEEVPPVFSCPAHTVDLGQKCAIYSLSRLECPPGFSLEGKMCRKTVFAAPIVEYTVTYTCTGKECGDHGTA